MMKVLTAGAALALMAAGSAHASNDDLINAFQKACKPGEGVRVDAPGDYGVIEIQAVRAALLKEFPLDFAVGQSAESLARRAMGDPASPAKTDEAKTQNAQLFRYRRIVEAWSAWPGAGTVVPTLQQGGLKIESVGARSLDTETRLTRLFANDGADLRIICRNPDRSASPVSSTTSNQPSLTVVNAAEDLDEGDITKKTFGEFSYSDNREARTQAWSVKVAAALQWPEKIGSALPFDSFTWAPLVYVAYDRQGENDPAKDGYVNNLDFGVQLNGALDLPWGETLATGYYGLSARYQTDDNFRSEVYAAEFRFEPPLAPIKHHNIYDRLWSGGPVAADFKWRADLVADWIEVSDAGRKVALVDKAEYVRLGYDIDLALRVGPSDKDWRVLFRAKYQLRDGRTEDGGDAQIFTGGLSYLASEDTRWKFGLTYERGENLESFERSELWKLAIGFRY
jgi:hypothetical protein